MNIAQGWGLILFVPEVYDRHNAEQGSNLDNCNAIFGSQYLKMTLISGLGPLAAKVGAYLVQRVAPLLASMCCSSLVSTVSFILLGALHNTVRNADIIMGVIKAAFAYLNLSLWLHMMSAFEGPIKTISTVVIDGSSKFGALFGCSFVAFLSIDTVKIIMSVLGVVQTIILIVICTCNRSL